MKKKHIIVASALLCLGAPVAIATAVNAASNAVNISTEGSDASLRCPGGMVRLSHVLDTNAPLFPGDPTPSIEINNTIAADGYKLEKVTFGTHTGTHLSAPGHFIEGATNVDALPAGAFVFPAYVIDVRARTAANSDFQLSVADVKAYERQVGSIPKGALIVLYTGFQNRWPGASYSETAPGISAAAVNWLFANRRIKGVGSDTFGPDATSDTALAASTAVFTNGGVTIENMDGLNQLHKRGDIVMAPTVRLVNGSGYQNDPLGCLRTTERNEH
jgi:kynurenine formamidase